MVNRRINVIWYHSSQRFVEKTHHVIHHPWRHSIQKSSHRMFDTRCYNGRWWLEKLRISMWLWWEPLKSCRPSVYAFSAFPHWHQVCLTLVSIWFSAGCTIFFKKMTAVRPLCADLSFFKVQPECFELIPERCSLQPESVTWCGPRHGLLLDLSFSIGSFCRDTHELGQVIILQLEPQKRTSEKWVESN